jgi:hypothetical protein
MGRIISYTLLILAFLSLVIWIVLSILRTDLRRTRE